MAENLISLVRRAKPKRAVLTSFTFGLAYFEAAILPVLRNAGCGDITVLLDEGEYLASLGSSFSAGAGRSYRLFPVRAPGGGIFHPKLAYLEGADTDCLVVGSGNLTQAGQGGQLESVDAVVSVGNSAVFAGAGTFFSALRRRLTQSSPQLDDLLVQLGERGAAQGAGAEGAQESSAQLMHTVERDAAMQLREVAIGWSSQYSRLTVMSPFHARDAGPVIEFAKGLGIARIEFALDPRFRTISLDADAFEMPANGAFVVPVLEGDMSRPAHAKWWELECERGVLVMTGSVNATEMSFNSTKNVEVALIRRLEADEPRVQWREESPTQLKYVPLRHSSVGSGEYAAQALLHEDGRLKGTVQARGQAPQRATLAVLSDGLEVARCEDLLLEDGTNFACMLDARLTGEPNALQIELTAPGFRARGWVLNTYQLELTESQRQISAALARIVRGSFTPDDEERMLQRFIELLNADHLGASAPRREGRRPRQRERWRAADRRGHH